MSKKVKKFAVPLETTTLAGLRHCKRASKSDSKVPGGKKTPGSVDMTPTSKEERARAEEQVLIGVGRLYIYIKLNQFN